MRGFWMHRGVRRGWPGTGWASVALLMLLVVVLASLVATAVRAAPQVRLNIRVGLLGLSSFQQVFQYYDTKNRVIAGVARELGYNLTIEWRTFPRAPELLAAMKAGDVQVGCMATFPFVAQIKQGVPLHPLWNPMGSYEWVMLVNRDSPIRTFDDLRGKKIGLGVGTEDQLVFENFALSEFGRVPAEVGIEYVSTPIPVPFVPEGMDARLLFVPATIPVLAQGRMSVLLSFFGTTGEHYRGPLGTGAGIRIPSVDRSPFSPEGFSALRQYCVAYGDFLGQHPNVAKALIIAYQQVIREVRGWPVDKIGDLYPADFWQTMDRKEFERLTLARDLMYKHRGWIWHTEGERTIAIKASEIMAKAGGIRSPLTSEEWCATFRQSLPIIKEAYDRLKFPTRAVFSDARATDLRGRPVWEACGR